jgi:thioredoxin reductase (NADPH)
MEVLVEEIITYGLIFILLIIIILYYIRKNKKKSAQYAEKLARAVEDGLHEPVSLYPVVNTNRCIQSGACIRACPEHDILGIVNGKATIINASQCIGHGACFLACPTEAITLKIGTEKRGVELPHIQPNFETNVRGIFIAGELGGMGLIRNAVTQGREAMENIVKSIDKQHKAEFDVIVVGSGPAGISATLGATKSGLKVLTLEQDSLGGTVYTYPRSKIVMTHAMDLPLYGKVKLGETSKDELLGLWNKVLTKHKISIREHSKVVSIQKNEDIFDVKIQTGEVFTSKTVLLALGRRGTPRKLNIPGEMSQKVAYRLLDAELIENKKIFIVGGGDSAVEAALLLANKNKVTLSYRGEKFNRLKPRNSELINNAMTAGVLEVFFNTQAVAIEPDKVIMKFILTNEDTEIENDQVYIFAGGELPAEFLKKTGIRMNTKFGEIVMSH